MVVKTMIYIYICICQYVCVYIYIFANICIHISVYEVMQVCVINPGICLGTWNEDPWGSGAGQRLTCAAQPRPEHPHFGDIKLGSCQE